MAVTRAIDCGPRFPGRAHGRSSRGTSAVVAAPLSLYLPVVAAEGRGATLTDVDGNTFIDFTGGVGYLNVGHSHPRVVAAAQEQLERFAHTDYTIVPYEAYVRLAERLIEVAPIRSRRRRRSSTPAPRRSRTRSSSRARTRGGRP